MVFPKSKHLNKFLRKMVHWMHLNAFYAFSVKGKNAISL